MEIRDIKIVGNRIKLHKNYRGWHLFICKPCIYEGVVSKASFEITAYKIPSFKLSVNLFHKKEKVYRLDINRWEEEIKIFGLFSIYIHQLFGKKNKIVFFKPKTAKYSPIPKGRLI